METNQPNKETNNTFIGYSEAANIEALTKITLADSRNPTLKFTWPRHREYDTNGDGVLTSDDLFCVPSDELNSLLRYSTEPDEKIIEILAPLPNSKLSRIFAQFSTEVKIAHIFHQFMREQRQRAVDILQGMKENPYNKNEYAVEGSTVNWVIRDFPDELKNSLIDDLEIIDPQFAANIRKHWETQPFSRNPEEFPQSGGFVEKEVIGDFPIVQVPTNARKVYQQQFVVSHQGISLQTFGVNDCVALGFLQKDGTKALTHLDVGMNIEDSIDLILYSFAKNGGSLKEVRAALIGGYDSSRKMIWQIKRRLQQAGIVIAVSRLLTGSNHSQQLLITDNGFFDFDWIGSEEDRIEFDKSANEL